MFLIRLCIQRTPSYEFKVVKHIKMLKAGPKKSIGHFQKIEMILK